MAEQSRRVQILDAISNSSIPRDNAERYVRQGRADWAGVSAIRFRVSDYRHQAAQRSLFLERDFPVDAELEAHGAGWYWHPARSDKHIVVKAEMGYGH